MSSLRAKDAVLYARAKRKQAAGKELSYTERQRLDLARDRRIARQEASEKKDYARSLNNDFPGPMFRRTRFGWRAVIPNDHPGSPYSTHDELEVVTSTGKPVWVTLVRLWFTGGDVRRSDWWSFAHGRRSQITQHIPAPLQQDATPQISKALESPLDEEDEERVSTAAGAAYLAAKKRRLDSSGGRDNTEQVLQELTTEAQKHKLGY
jgi:hypothetical protein